MTVNQMIRALQEAAHVNPEAKVVFAYASADHWSTEVAEEAESIDHEIITWSEYHNKYKIADVDEMADTECVVVIR